ncbi:Por secretion system C-terminal sorting domain-containing protein [Aquimarina amphilecti]|uniref:Por secretion system C-terminal sorting domain-containing protein n=2 Tax=Aquimarina amphilecti TaxID=1038014 RepID=A0A1H7GX71_AQUAM|nr:Por secretion system C-terminal sorting domain-containing protein [Aquimarina amphilecti]
MISLCFAQNPWTKTNTNLKSSNVISTKKNLPTNTLFTLDVNSIQKILANSPLRGKSTQSSTIIPLPNADGSMESYRVFEAPVFSDELAAKYPGIKSYSGQSIADPTTRVRFSMSPLGLQSMRLSNGATVFIEPISTDGTTYTIYTRDQKSDTIKKFECLVDGDTPNLSQSTSSNMKNADDSTLRTYRLAVSTNGEYTEFHGGTKAGALAAINTTMTRVNGIFESDFAVTMVLIGNTDDVIYTNANTDPYTGSFNSQLQSTLTNVIGEANYDIGHLFAKAGDNGNAGCIGCVCVNGSKGSAFTSRSTPIGDAFDVDYVAHEIGHQFGANHTFSIRNEGTNAHFEPGSGTTIMGYAGITGATDVQQNSDPYFHFYSIEQVTNYVKSTSCQTNTNTGNAIPTADAGSNYTIPRGTPFVLEGQGSDTNSGDVLTYCWEQRDENNASSTYPSVTGTSGVAFRSFNPSISNKRYFPRLETVKTGATSWQWEAIPNVTRTLNFRLTVRDNKAGGAGNNSDDMSVNVTANAGPFIVNTPNTNVSWSANANETITWDVAGTTGNGINASNVDILLSTDGGDTYSIALATGVPNDGSHNITVPNVQGTQNRIMVKGSGNIFFDISNTDFEISGVVTPDTQAPSTPSSLTASNTTSSSTDLSWNASTDNVAVTGYDVYRGDTVIATVASASYTASGLSSETAYSFRVKAKDAAGNESNFSNTVNITTDAGTPNTGCTGGISSFPYSEGFENGLGNWSQATSDDINWTRDSNGTPSRNTGPSSAAEGSFYMYIEASGNGNGYPNKRAILNSPCFDLTGTNQATFTFQYHMYGNSMGTLTLEGSNDNGATWTSLWSESGNQGNSWQNASVDLAALTGSGVQLRFNGITSSSWAGDITVDDINLTTGTITPPSCTDVTLSITLDNYPEETSWQITNSSNQVVASGGTYASQPDGSTISITECLDAGSYTFTINDSYGDGICCSYGNGSYTLTAGSTILASGGSFGGSESTTFSVGGTARGPEIESFTTTNALQIGAYPNPIQTNGYLNVIAPNLNINYNLYDLRGRRVSNGTVNNKSINLQGIQSGSYILSLDIEGKLSNHAIIIK